MPLDRNKTPAARERKRRYRERHREALRAWNREYARRRWAEDADYRERCVEEQRERRRTNPERVQEIARRSYLRHAEKRRAEAIAYALANPEKRRDYNAARCADKDSPAYAAMLDANSRRRARIRGATITEKIDRLAVYERDCGRCHICGHRCSKTNFHLDHLVPLSKGGDHTYANVAIAHPRCNLQRGAGRTPAQLLLEGGCAA